MGALSGDEALLHVAYLVFLPPKLPQQALNDTSQSQVDLKLISLVLGAIDLYRYHSTHNTDQWNRLYQMLRRMARDVSASLVAKNLSGDMGRMSCGDILALHIKEQNAAVLVRKEATTTTFEIFEIQAPNVAVMSTPGKLVRQFPGPAVQIPNLVLNDRAFAEEISSFLAQMSAYALEGSTAKTTKAGSTVSEVRDTADPHYISQLFFAILRGVGVDVKPKRVVKRIADEVLWKDAYLPWRRSPLWLIIRVAIQTSLDSIEEYKHFMAFFHADILRIAHDNLAFSDDLVFIMRAKLARRLLKVQHSAPDYLIQVVKKTSACVEKLLQDRWTTAQDQAPKLLPLPVEHPSDAISQSIPHTRQYIATITQRRPKPEKSPRSTPTESSRILNGFDFIVYNDSALAAAFSENKHIALCDFESAVIDHLSTWVSKNLNSELACATIHSCFEQYTKVAPAFYTQDMADRSIMILTAMALWIALDQLVISLYPLLLDYSPEINESLMDVLLLRSSKHLGCARDIQAHLRCRHTGSRPSIFADSNTNKSFAVRFFHQTPALQAIKTEIEQDALARRAEKVQELNTKNAEYNRLQSQIQLMTCTCPPKPVKKKKKCQRCRIQSTASNMRIDVHEWPLSSSEPDAKAVVFELNCPDSLNYWSRLKSSKHRITIATTSKSFLRSHYKKVRLPSNQGTICVQNGCIYKLFDKTQETQTWANGPFAGTSFEPYGIFGLPESSPYRHLSYALPGTLHTSNQVLADQSECPPAISVHEHYAFGTLRSGGRLQWMNIVRGLEENCLSFNHREVDLLHTQAAWQIGPLLQDGKSRDWHLELGNPHFAQLLVSGADRFLERVKGSWLESVSVRTLVMLVTRLLASTTDTNLKQAIYRFLRQAREVTFKWLQELLAKLAAIDAELQVKDYQIRVCEMAAICRSTYDVGDADIAHLFARNLDYHIVLFCSIVLLDNRPSELWLVPPGLQILICRDRRLALRIAPTLLQGLSRIPRLFDGAISLYWNNFQPGRSTWVVFPNSRWVATVTTNTTTRSSQHVYINVLDGQLLVDGKPLGRLPKEYTDHPTYVRLFGERVLSVAPSSSPETHFVACSLVEGCEVHFSMNSRTKQLIIRAQREDTILELVPHNLLQEDFPRHFSSEYHHWIDLKTRTVEFRPRAEPWISRNSNWRLIPSSSYGVFIMRRAIENRTVCLLDIHSATFRAIASWLAPFEDARYLHVTCSRTASQKIIVNLPRTKLVFFVNENRELQSDNFSGLVVDERQSTGTMFGLRNKLVLRGMDKVKQSLPRSRCVLIPYGTVKFGARSGVTINLDTEHDVVFYQYKIDTDMGNLTGSVSLTSRLFKIYIHALTSHCLPDPLTGRTGTEEALHDLLEPATLSFDQIDSDQARLLQLIGALTPRRNFYPAHLQSMMTVEWLDLPSLAQHNAFAPVVNFILDQAQAFQPFNPSGFNIEPYKAKPSGILLERATVRARWYYPMDITIRLPNTTNATQNLSRVYEPRDSLPAAWAEERQVALWTSALVHSKWRIPVYTAANLISLAESWGHIGGSRQNFSMKFSPDWLVLDLSSSWIYLHNLCRDVMRSSNRYQLSCCLAAAAYSGSLPRSVVPILLAFSNNPRFRTLVIPAGRSYQLSDGYQPTQERIRAVVSAEVRAIANTPTGRIPKIPGESKASWAARKQEDYNSKISDLQQGLTRYWMIGWPSAPSDPAIPTCSAWIDTASALRNVGLYFDSCNRNVELRRYLQDVQNILASLPTTSGLDYHPVSLVSREPTSTMLPSSIFVSQPYLLRLMTQPISSRPSESFGNVFSLFKKTFQLIATPVFSTLGISHGDTLALAKKTSQLPDTTRLRELIINFQDLCVNRLHRQYRIDLESSRIDLDNTAPSDILEQIPSLSQLEQNRERCCNHMRKSLEDIKTLLGPRSEVENIVSLAGIWPRITAGAVLERLALWSRTGDLPASWYDILIKYACAYAEYQRSQRLIILSVEGKLEEFHKEVDSIGAESTSQSIHPADWLLVQIDGNFGVRPTQALVAQEMTLPSSRANTILQLNMGEGKSSVIIPIIAASLADRSQLVRVIVLKPLWRQMFQLLIGRLAGLAGRRIYYLPFGRHIRLDDNQAKQIQHMYSECMRDGGLLLVQPEHILSFKLLGIERTISSSSPQEAHISQRLRRMQIWLSQNTRDILDESDEILHVRYQLVYTMGHQLAIEGHPDRWTITQQILPIVAQHIHRLKQHSLNELKYESRPLGQFPFIHITSGSDDVMASIIKSVANDVIAGCIPNLNFGLLTLDARNKVFQLLTEKDLTADIFLFLGELGPSVKNGLLLLRGLLACGVLKFALRHKYYRVDYGLDPSRSLMAVPYQAKDIPSLRAEFGHPDIAIVLTCLSYYYHGLTSDQLDLCFELLHRLDNPDSEYDQWVCDNAVPSQLLHLSGVNLKNREQFTTKIVPAFSSNMAVINFFLSSVVFPKSAKQYPHKLSTSGWDLAEVKKHVTTGFSGTNDNRYLLPASISQSDPVKQSSTNALVLAYLLQSENNHYLGISDPKGEICSSKEFLRMLVKQSPEIRVLLDVGAQMLDLRNDELVRFWLELRLDVSAAVYFNEKDELVIMPRQGLSVPFFSSPFSQQLDKCIVYLDEGHTRGTDLDLPLSTRAAVTLGPKVTKDQLIQGCMRMRKLGRGQSVLLCAPPEVDSEIRAIAQIPLEKFIDTVDILRWAMLKTCSDLDHHVPHWVQQGIEYTRRTTGLNAENNPIALRDSWVSPEYRTLQDLYGASSSQFLSSCSLVEQAFKTPSLKQRLSVLGIRKLDNPGMDEEQEREREVSHEAEREQQVERPPKLHPSLHSMHPVIRNFAQTGVVPHKSKKLVPLWHSISSCGSPTSDTWASKLLASVDFFSTLVSSKISQATPNEYMRPIHWLLSGPNGIVIVISPFEANQILPEIRNSRVARLHIYTAQVTCSMMSFSDLRFYTVPTLPNSQLVPVQPKTCLQLDLLAGKLYLDTYYQYRSLCTFLGIYLEIDAGQEGDEIKVQSDGFVLRGDRRRFWGQLGIEYSSCGFDSSPVAGIRDLIAYRRKGMDYLRTHIGQVLHGRRLNPNDF